MAQAVANHALSGEADISFIVAATAGPLFDWKSWDADAARASCGARVDQMPVIGPPGHGARRGDRAPELRARGRLDRRVRRAARGRRDEVGDVLVILGTTLIVWAVVPEAVEVPNYYAMPNTAAGTFLVGGPSNAGGLFLNWATALLGDGAADSRSIPARVPVWVPYPRGERVPLQDPDRRGQLVDLDLTHGPAAGAAGRARGDGVRDAPHDRGRARCPRRASSRPVAARALDGWVEALADCTGLPVHVCAVPEGGALGAAFLARLACGLETSMTDAGRWARTVARRRPVPAWQPHVDARYARFCEVAG